MKDKLKVRYVDVATLKPHKRNSRKHTDEQIAQVANSIAEFGWTNPILVDEESNIIAGHARYAAAKLRREVSVPVIELRGLTEFQKRAYLIADNKLALNSSWDDLMLGQEIYALQQEGIDMSLLGFGDDELGEALDQLSSDETIYSKKVISPIYEVQGERPKVADLVDTSRADELKARIESLDAPDDVKAFLFLAAFRHAVFDYQKIAEFYAHASQDVQREMEESALVVIDFNKAIELGFVNVTDRLLNVAQTEMDLRGEGAAELESDDDDI